MATFCPMARAGVGQLQTLNGYLKIIAARLFYFLGESLNSNEIFTLGGIPTSTLNPETLT